MSVVNFELLANGEKIVMVGDSSVGKSSILIKYMTNNFSENIKPTIGCDHYEKELEVSGTKVKLSIWDTAGQERFRGLTSCYYKKAKAIIIVIDISKKQTFDKLDSWREEIKTFADTSVLIYIIANKMDQVEKRQVSKADCENYIRKNKLNGYFETSALDNGDKKIEKAFQTIAETILSTKNSSDDQQKGKVEGNRIDLNSNATKDSGCKC